MSVSSIYRNLSNLPGFTTKRKIVIIESDDWGSIRMPSKEAYLRLKSAGVDLDSMDYKRYNLNDSLACRKDFESLYEVLDSFKDMNGSSCVFTAMSVVANPDFNKIKESDYTCYYYEPFTTTLKKYYPGDNVFSLWKEGIERKLFVPQFHGREHLNVRAWLKALQDGHKSTIKAFQEQMWGFVPDNKSGKGVENQAAFQLTDIADIEPHKQIIKEGLDLFESIFGYRARYFVPPNGPINNRLNTLLVNEGIEYRSTSKIQSESTGFNQTRKVIHWLGQKDSNGLRYITRNCFFEPSLTGRDWIDSCLNEIRIAFRWGKPAIISSHRVNYVGALESSNRESSLSQLTQLLRSIQTNWPEAEFMTTVQLGDIIKTK